MKLCKCGNEKTGRDYCHSCAAQKQRDRRSKMMTTWVYYLPEEHYIGITNNITTRMWQHANNESHCIKDFEVLCGFERRVDAHYLETLLHMRGYNGFKK